MKRCCGVVLAWLAAAAAPACAVRFDALATVDAGTDAHALPSDADSPEDVGVDAVSGDAAPAECPTGVQWIDTEPPPLPAESSFVLTPSATGFELFYESHARPVGLWPTWVHLPISGPASAPIEAGWVTLNPTLFAGADERGRPFFAMLEGDRVRWSAAPTGDSWTTFDGELYPPLAVGDLAFRSEGLLLACGSSGPPIGSGPSVFRRDASGETSLSFVAPSPGDGAVTTPRLRIAPDGEVWMGYVAERRHPLFVSADHRLSLDGCDTMDLDFVAGPGVLGVVANCFRDGVRSVDVSLVGEGGVTAQRTLEACTGLASAPHIAWSGDRLVVVHCSEAGPRVDVLRASDLLPLASTPIPGAVATRADRWTTGVAAHDDGTLAVAWAHVAEPGIRTAAVQRFRACE